MPKKPIIIADEIIAKSRFFQIEELHLRFSNGQERHFERLASSQRSSVMVVPMLDHNTVLMVREYGAGIDDYFLSLPKGIVEDDENILQGANRELMEEVGFAAKQLNHLKTLTLSPGYMARKLEIVLAQDLFPQKLIGDEPEEIEVVPFKLTQLDELLKRNDVHEAACITALFLTKELLHGK